MRPTRLSRRDFATSILGAGASGLLASTTVFARQGTRPIANGTRLDAQVMDLRRFGGTSVRGTHRLGYNEEDKQARVQVAAWMREAGLAPRTDFASNLIGHRAGRMDLPPLVVGSHIDSVPDAAATTATSGRGRHRGGARQSARRLQHSGSPRARCIAGPATTRRR